MTPEQLQIVTSTATVVESHREVFAPRFYDRLVRIAPSTRALFPDDLGDQSRKPVDELVALARAAGDFSGFVHLAREIGARYRHRGARSTDLANIGDALQGALEDVLGEAFTPEVGAAWSRLHHLMSETMMEGAGSELFSER